MREQLVRFRSHYNHVRYLFHPVLKDQNIFISPVYGNPGMTHK